MSANVIPAKAGILYYQIVPDLYLRGNDDSQFFRDYQTMYKDKILNGGVLQMYKIKTRNCNAVPGKINFGGDLLSHIASHAVPSALKGLTSVFGMGTGVSPSQLPPKTLFRFY
jgi:hypothetical protein